MLPQVFEKRNYPRYPMPDGVIVTLKPNAEILGQLLDIGPGGLAFRYVELGTAVPEPDAELVILQPRPRIYLEGIPFRTVSDVAVPNEFSFSALSIRRHSVAFGTLSDSQRKQLERLIRSQPPFPLFIAHSSPSRCLSQPCNRHP
jgi:hypothetical protein